MISKLHLLGLMEEIDNSRPLILAELSKIIRIRRKNRCCELIAAAGVAPPPFKSLLRFHPMKRSNSIVVDEGEVTSISPSLRPLPLAAVPSAASHV